MKSTFLNWCLGIPEAADRLQPAERRHARDADDAASLVIRYRSGADAAVDPVSVPPRPQPRV